MFDRDCNLAALTFLCSRLLGAAKKGIAATVIFRAYRQAKARRNVRQRCIALRLAHACQSAYNTREQVVGAVRVLQRYWRAYLGQKKYGSILSQDREIDAHKRILQTQREVRHDYVDIWLL